MNKITCKWYHAESLTSSWSERRKNNSWTVSVKFLRWCHCVSDLFAWGRVTWRIYKYLWLICDVVADLCWFIETVWIFHEKKPCPSVNTSQAPCQTSMGKKNELSKNNVSNFMWGLRTQSLTAFWRLNDTQYVTQYFLISFYLFIYLLNIVYYYFFHFFFLINPLEFSWT